MRSISDDIGIYVGSSFVYGCTRKRGIVLCEPAVAAVESESGRILKVGVETEELIKKAKLHIEEIYPFSDGNLSDNITFERLLRHIIKRICGTKILKPRVALCLPDNLTNVERSAAKEAAYLAGARQTTFVSKMLAASYGIGMKPENTQGRLLIHFGGGCTIFALVSRGKVVFSRKTDLSQNKINAQIFDYIKDKYGIVISENTAESVKNNLGCFIPRDFNLKMNIIGRYIASGKTAELTIDADEIYSVIKNLADSFLQELADVMRKIPADFSKDIAKDGVVLTGGGSALYGIDKIISKSFCIPAEIDLKTGHSVADGLSLMIYSGTIFTKRD